MKTQTPNIILFICTGNYYRSRFAEAVFNHHAKAHAAGWQAMSRGLAIHLVLGPISPHVVKALQARGIPLTCTTPDRTQLTEADLAQATRVVALKEREHRPMIRKLFPAWEDRVEYWNVHDVEYLSPHSALPEIERCVLRLLKTDTSPRKRSHHDAGLESRRRLSL